MLTTILLTLMCGVLGGLMGLFPAYTLPSSIASAGANLGSAIASADAVFPVSTLGICLLVVLGARLILTTVAFLLWLWQQVPFTFK